MLFAEVTLAAETVTPSMTIDQFGWLPRSS